MPEPITLIVRKGVTGLQIGGGTSAGLLSSI